MTNRASSDVAPSDRQPTSAVSQTLWHVRRGGGFPIIAQLLKGAPVVQISYGTVGSQQRSFDHQTAAVQWSEKVLAHLEEAGFSRRRVDRRREDLPAAPAR